MKKVVQDLTSGGIDWQREKWQSGLGSKFIHQGEKNAVKYADEVIVLSKGVQDYFKETYGRKTHFIPNGVNRPQTREANLITDKFGLKKDSYILFLGRLVPEKGIRYLVEAFKNVKTDKKLVIAGGSSDTDSFMENFMNVAVTPVTTTLYNYFCKATDEVKVRKARNYVMIFAALIVSCAFPARFILEVYLTKYIDSAKVMFLLFAAQIFYMDFLSAGQCATGNGGPFVLDAAVARGGSTSNGTSG